MPSSSLGASSSSPLSSYIVTSNPVSTLSPAPTSDSFATSSQASASSDQYVSNATPSSFIGATTTLDTLSNSEDVSSASTDEPTNVVSSSAPNGELGTVTQPDANSVPMTMQTTAVLTSPYPEQVSATSAAPVEPPISSTFVPTSTSNWLPTALVTASSDINDTQSGSTDSNGSQLATQTLPQAIGAPTEVSQPEGYTLITIGFKQALNYPFVVTNAVTSAQIFAYLPETLNFPFDDAFSDITVARLGPLKVSNRDYLLTIAEVYFPSAQVENLQTLIQNDESKFYAKNATKNLLAAFVDATIPLTGLVEEEGSTSSGSSQSSGASSNVSTSSEGESEDGGKSGYRNSGTLGSSYYKSSTFTKQGGRSKLVGLIVGVVCGALVYIALMVITFRFIIKKMQLKASNPNLDETSSVGSASASGSLPYGNEKVADDQASITPSAKINNWMQQNHYDDLAAGNNLDNASSNEKPSALKISRPIATENSLGWNDV